VPSELLVNVDHPETAPIWIDLAYNTSGWVVPVFSNNVHEIRAYNRLGHMARGQVLVILQVGAGASWASSTPAGSPARQRQLAPSLWRGLLDAMRWVEGA
jgi:hypothetical protein